MPTNLSGRITLILVLLLAWLAAIFWPLLGHPKLAFDSSVPWTKKINLKPGIDMVGGTSLLYQIKPPEGTPATEDLVKQVMSSLRKRVDPDNLFNYVWRPQGTNQLEIQIPLSGDPSVAEARQNELIKAGDALEATNINRSEVIAAVEQTGGHQRAELKTLAMASAVRTELFDQLVRDFDEIDAARKAKDAAKEADARNRYDALKEKIERTNLNVGVLKEALATPKRDVPSVNQAVLASVNKIVAGSIDPDLIAAGATTLPSGSAFAKRQQAVDDYVKAFDEFQKVAASVEGSSNVKRKLEGSGILEFHILATPPSMARGENSNISDQQYREAIERLQKEGPRGGGEVRWFEVDNPLTFRSRSIPFGDKQYVLAWVTPEKSLDSRPGQLKWTLANAGISTGMMNERVVSFSFDPNGATLFGELTSKNLGQQLATMLDGRVITAPNIKSAITGGSGQIDGVDADEMNYLVPKLKAGSLPAQLSSEPIRETTVGAPLGADNLKRGLSACVIGLIIVSVFMIFYYHLAGVVAVSALLLNMVFILGTMAIFNATFTLPAIAGIVLTIGTSVDANVLIFERLREEQKRGLSLRMALRNAYDRAFSAIVDSNMTTAITAAVLMWKGTEEVKGFGTTLLIGLVSSMFTALFVTKTIFAFLLKDGGLERLGSFPLKYPKWDQLLHPKIDWMGKAWAFYTFSAIFIAGGLLAFFVKLHQGEMLDVEFANGTKIQFELKQPGLPQAEVRALLENESKKRPHEFPVPSVQTVGSGETTYEVTTPNDNVAQVRSAVLEALGPNRLQIELPSDFALAGETIDKAMEGAAIVPIETATQTIAGITPRSTTKHVGGAAIVLKDMSIPLSAEQIRTRIQRQRLVAQSGANAPAGTNAAFDVEMINGAKPTALILFSDPDFLYQAGDDLKVQQWKAELVDPMWKLANAAVNKPAEFQQVTSFSPQVAAETQQAAIVSLVLAIVVIMAYIWIRFGNLKYGSATVIALVHDALFAIAAVGFSHYLAGTFIGNILQLEGFRLNVTMVAAVLTVMGYSMIDTIVVFDRIRENRGKLGHLDAKVINDAINQTFSRTLLTSGSTIVTVAVMYLIGGSGIHGFTFVLLIGILVGTYSSVGIAAPMLLLGSSRTAATEGTGVQSPKSAGQLQRA